MRSVLGDLDVDCDHVSPQLASVNGTLAELRISPSGATLAQHLT
ncbi:hypothetical protein [Kineococcus sp. R86509]